MATLVAERSPRALDPRAPAGAPSAASVSDFMRGTALLDPVLGFPVARGRAPMVYNAPFAPTGFGAAFVSLEVAPDDYPFALNAHYRTKIAPGAFVLISRNAATVGLLDDCGDAVRIAATSAAGIARPLTPPNITEDGTQHDQHVLRRCLPTDRVGEGDTQMATAPEVKKGITEEQQRELDDVFTRARKALAIIETYDQARVDRLCQAVAWAVANKQTFTRLVDMGIKESGLGDAVSRMGKRMKIRGVLRDALRQKSVGIIEELPEKGIVKYGKPAGIVACIVPTTNPDLTPAGNAIYGIKARDCVIFSPHPRSKKTSFETVRLMREALVREGAPADILQCLTKVNIPMSQARCPLASGPGWSSARCRRRSRPACRT
jgi:hypothetical protein